MATKVLLTVAGLLSPLLLPAATINLRSAILGTGEGSLGARKLQEKRALAEDRLKKGRAEIQALREKLAAGKEIMTADAQADLASSIEQKTKQLQRDAEDAQDELTQSESEMVNRIRSRILALLPRCAERHGYRLVIDVSNPYSRAIYVSQSADITAEIVRMYDAAYPAAQDAPNTITRRQPPSPQSSLSP